MNRSPLLQSPFEEIVLTLINPMHILVSSQDFLFEFKVENRGQSLVQWNENHPLTLASRWFRPDDTKHHIAEGERAVFGFLSPGKPDTLKLKVRAPEVVGLAILRVSFVCEGAFWFYEQLATGWQDLPIEIVAPPVWPEDLRQSAESRVMRGSLAAHSIFRTVEAAAVRCQPPSQSAKSNESAPDGPDVEPMTIMDKPTAPNIPPLNTTALEAIAFGTGITLSAEDLPIAEIDPCPKLAWWRHPIRSLMAYLQWTLENSSIAHDIQILKDNAVNHQEISKQNLALVGEIRADQDAMRAHIADALKNATMDLQEIRGELASNLTLTSRIIDTIRRANAPLLKTLSTVIEDNRHKHEVVISTFENQMSFLESVATKNSSELADLAEMIELHKRDMRALALEVSDHREETNLIHQMVDQQIDSVPDLINQIAIYRDETNSMVTQFDAQLVALRDSIARYADVQNLIGNRMASALSITSLKNKLNEINKGIEETYATLAGIVDTSIHLAQKSDFIRQLVEDQSVATRDALEQSFSSINSNIDLRASQLGVKTDYLIHRQTIAIPKMGYIISRNELGFFAIPETDIETVSYYASGHLPEPGSLSILRKLLQVGSTFIDTGANVGLFSVAAGRIIGPSGKIVAIEPAPGTVGALQTTLRLNGLASIADIHQVAAGRRAGMAQLNVSPICGLSSLLPLDEVTSLVEVQVSALDDIIGSHPVDVVKVDVEGWELEVFAGMANIFSNNANLSIVVEFSPTHLTRSGSKISDWEKMVNLQGFEVFMIDEVSGSLTKTGLQDLISDFSVNLLLSRGAHLELIND